MKFKRTIIVAVGIIIQSSCLYTAEQANRSIESTQQLYETQYNVACRSDQPYTNQLHSLMHQLEANNASLTEADKNITTKFTLKHRDLIRSNYLLSLGRRDLNIIGRSNEIINSLIPEIHEIQDRTQRTLLLALTAAHNVELDTYGNRHRK